MNEWMDYVTTRFSLFRLLCRGCVPWWPPLCVYVILMCMIHEICLLYVDIIGYAWSVMIWNAFRSFLCKKGILVIYNQFCYFWTKTWFESILWYVMNFKWYIIFMCSETIIYSLVRIVFTKVGFCSVIGTLKASFEFWWVRKLIWEIQRYIWDTRGKSGLEVRFCGLRFRDFGTRVAWGLCHVSPREACIVLW